MLSFVGIEKAATKGIHMTQYKLPLHMFISRLYFEAIAKFSIDIAFSVSIFFMRIVTKDYRTDTESLGFEYLLLIYPSFCEQNITPSMKRDMF